LFTLWVACSGDIGMDNGVKDVCALVWRRHQMLIIIDVCGSQFQSTRSAKHRYGTLTARTRGRLNTHQTAVRGSASKNSSERFATCCLRLGQHCLLFKIWSFSRVVPLAATAKARSMVSIIDRVHTLFMALCSDHADSREVE